MKDSGKYRVTHHLGRRPDSKDAEVIFSYPGVATRTVRSCTTQTNE